MLTKVYLEGAMGRNFGREWTLDIHSPAEALQLIGANVPRFKQWVRDNLKRFEACMVICKYRDGRIEALNNDNFSMDREPAEIHFTPIISGSGKVFQWVAAVAMIIIGIILCCFQQYWGATAAQVGVSMIVGGAGMLLSAIITAIMGRQKKNDNSSGTSYYFNGAQNTTQQGVPVPLVFGRCKVGSAVISSSIIASEAGEIASIQGSVERVPDRI